MDCVENGVKHGKSQSRIKSHDYSAWDNFDVEKAMADVERDSAPECETEEDEDEEEVQRKQREELQAKQKALIEKDKGNEFFKTGDHDAAVNCYTRGMEADPHNALLPANRAMAFLKLKKYELAEADCNLAIELDPSYPKAFARRGAARLALNKLKQAREDFEAVLVFDPANKQAMAELDKIKVMTDKTAKSSASHTSVSAPRQDAVKTKGTSVAAKTPKHKTDEKEPGNVVQPFTRPPHLRSKKPLRRMAIEEVGGGARPKLVQSADGTGLLAAGVQTPPPPLPSPLDAQPQPLSVEAQGSWKEEKVRASVVKVADSEEEAGVGIGAVIGGEGDTCHHADRKGIGSEQPGVSVSLTGGEEMTQRLPDTKEDPKTTPDVAQTGSVPPPPSNSFQLESDLRKLNGCSNLLHQYVKQIEPTAFPQILQQPMEPDILYKLLNVLKESYIPHEDKALVFAVLHNLSLVRRFDMAVMFMSTAEKAVVQALFDHIASAEDISGASVTALKRKYSL